MADKPRPVPSLDLLKGFESAARHLNFTRAADELYLTQSAVSRQVQTLEERLGVRLFVRQRRGLALTHEGDRLYRSVHAALREMRDAIDSLSPRADGQRVTLTSTMAFCSLWLIPRLGEFRRACPEVDVHISANDRVLNLDRERIDASVRYLPAHLAPKGSVRLFDEELVPVCSPALIARTGKPLRNPGDLAHYVLLHMEDRDNPSPWLSWGHWFDAVGEHGLKPAGAVSFNYFEQVIRAALAGHGVALGRLPLIHDLLREGGLIAPFATRAPIDRAYFVIQADFARGRREVSRFVQWLIEAARSDVERPLVPKATRARAPRSATMARPGRRARPTRGEKR
ncbi:MAG TPA: LysR substrate-binding domain-containing protein [Burkholderiales bacterium]|jgi:DNA-binding transcriptional LysR family regulator